MGERRRALCKRARPFCAYIKDGGQPASANGAEVRGLSVFYSAGQSESAASSATTTLWFDWSTSIARSPASGRPTMRDANAAEPRPDNNDMRFVFFLLISHKKLSTLLLFWLTAD